MEVYRYENEKLSGVVDIIDLVSKVECALVAAFLFGSFGSVLITFTLLILCEV